MTRMTLPGGGVSGVSVLLATCLAAWVVAAAGPPPAPADHTTNTEAHRADAGFRFTVRHVLEGWNPDADEQDQALVELQLRAFLHVAGLGEPDRLVVWDLDEVEFVRLPAVERDALRGAYIARSGQLKGISVELLKSAEAAHMRGDRAEAVRRLRALQRCVDANTRQGVVELGRIVMESIQRSLDDRLRAFGLTRDDLRAEGEPG